MHITDKEGIKTLETSLLRSREVLFIAHTSSVLTVYIFQRADLRTKGLIVIEFISIHKCNCN